MPIPVPVSSQLIKEIDYFYQENKSPSKNDITDLKEQVRKVVNENFGKAQVIYGLIAGLEGNMQDVRSRYRQAQSYCNNDYFCYHNFILAFNRVGDTKNAQDALQKAYNSYQRGNLTQLEFLLWSSPLLGLNDIALTLLEEAKNLNVPFYLEHTHQILKDLKDTPMENQLFEQLMYLVTDTLHKKGIQIRNYFIRHNTYDGDDTIVASFQLKNVSAKDILSYQDMCDNAILDFEDEHNIHANRFAFVLCPDERFA